MTSSRIKVSSVTGVIVTHTINEFGGLLGKILNYWSAHRCLTQLSSRRLCPAASEGSRLGTDAAGKAPFLPLRPLLSVQVDCGRLRPMTRVILGRRPTARLSFMTAVAAG